jgi:hypothetical protein
MSLEAWPRCSAMTRLIRRSGEAVTPEAGAHYHGRDVSRDLECSGQPGP